MEKRADGKTENQNKGILSLHIVLAVFFAVCLLQAFFKYYPSPTGLIPPIPYFGLLSALIFPVGSVLFVVFVEIACVGYAHSSWRQLFVRRRDQSVGYDLFFYILHVFRVWQWVVVFGTLGLYLYVKRLESEFLGTSVGWAPRFSTGSGIVTIALFAFVWSFFDYWNHRIQHTRLFWPIHRLHHSATTLTLFTTHRNNPFVFIFEPFVRVWPYILMAPEPHHLLIFGACNHIYQFLVHSNLRSDWGWFGRWILISPAAHRIHHSNNPDHYMKNLAVAVIWDRVFGTWIEPDGKPLTLGVEEAGHNGGNLLKDIYRDAYLFFRGGLFLLGFKSLAPDRSQT